MPGKTLFGVPATGPGNADRRIDLLEQGVQKFVEQSERAHDAGGKWTIRRLNANGAAQVWDIVLGNPSAGAFRIVIPDPSDCKLGRVTVKNDSTSTNAMTLAPAGGGTIDGASTLVMNTSRLVKHLVSDGLEWKVM